MLDFSPRVAVVGQLNRDLVLLVDRLPEPHTAVDASQRLELLGGKGANQAVALAQLGARPSLVAVAGDDPVGTWLLEQATRDGIDVSAVARRPGTASGLIVEVLTGHGRWRYFQHLPDEVRLAEGDVAAAAGVLFAAEAVLVQLQQPPAAALAAARTARRAGGLVLLDGAPPPDSHRAPLLTLADVVRADARETELLTGVPTDAGEHALHAAAEDLLRRGPRMVALTMADASTLAVWDETWDGSAPGRLVAPASGGPVVDTTGAGDAFCAALTVALLRRDGPAGAVQRAVAAASATVRHVAGRPRLDPSLLRTPHSRAGGTP